MTQYETLFAATNM